MPNQKKVRLGVALEENDLVDVVSILAKNPKLANMPFLDGSNELPLDRAIRLECDDCIIEVLKDNGAQLGNGENQPNFMNIFCVQNTSMSDELSTW